MKHNFEERRQRRIENAEDKATKNAEKSDMLWQKANDMSSVIPMGQPILVGHHSEGADRRYRNGIDNTRRKSIEAMEKADYYEVKAESIKSNDAIFSDDPKALEKLEEKLKGLERNADFMKQANRYIKKSDKAGFLSLPNATENIWDELHKVGRFGGWGFAHFELSNNSAERRRLKQRIEKLRSQAERAMVDLTVNGVRVFENREANRLQMFFDGKPKAEIISQLKSHGFRWSRTEQAWQRHISSGALYWAKGIANNINGTNPHNI